MKSLAAVLVAGALGTAARFTLDVALAHSPVSTLIVNLLGSFALGYLVARVWPRVAPWVRAGLGPGLLGSFTTFSAVTIAVVGFAQSGEWMPALTYLAATLFGGLLAAWLGLRVGGSRARVEAAPS